MYANGWNCPRLNLETTRFDPKIIPEMNSIGSAAMILDFILILK